MANIVKNILIGCLCILVHTHAANAAECSDYDNNPSECESNNCLYNPITSLCLGCASNEYYDTTEKNCKQCPGDFPNSPAGSVGINLCYRDCKPETDANDLPGPSWSAPAGVSTMLGKRYYNSNNTCTILSCATNYVNRQAHGEEEGWTDQNRSYPYEGAMYCFACPEKYPFSKPNAYATSLEYALKECYKNCDENKPSVPNSTDVTSDSTEAYYGDICKYSVACDTSGANGCPAQGFTAIKNGTESPECHPNVSEDGQNCSIYGIAGGITGRHFISFGTFCYVTKSTCEAQGDSYTFIPAASCASAAEQEYGGCQPKEKECKYASELWSYCSMDKIGGTATLYDRYYDYSDCYCSTNTTIENGTGTEDCYFNADGKGITEYCKKTISTCVSGYCVEDETAPQCFPAPVGSYSGDSDKGCTKCPAGATTDAPGQGSITSCHYLSTTVFKDNNGEFSIPNMINASISWL